MAEARRDTYTLDVVVTGTQNLNVLQARLGALSQSIRASASASTGLVKATGDIAKAGRGTNLAIQNAAFQVQDFAVQVAGGTSAARALGQQLPQLLVGFGAFGAVIGAAAAILIPLTSEMKVVQDAMKALAENADIAFGAITALGTLLAGKFLAGQVAAKGGMIALTASTISAANAMFTLRGALIATGFGAIAVTLGLLVTGFLRLREATGSWYEAARITIGAIREQLATIPQYFSLIARNADVLWQLFKGFALNAVADVLDSFDSLLSLTVDGKEIFNIKMFDTENLRTSTDILKGQIVGLLNEVSTVAKNAGENSQKFADAWTNSRFSINIENAAEGIEKASKASKSLSEGERFLQRLGENTIKVRDETAALRLEYDLLKQGMSSGEIERAVELQQLLAEATRLGVANTEEFTTKIRERSAALKEMAGVEEQLRQEQESVQQVKDAFDDIGAAIQNNLFSAIDGLIDGTKSAGKAFKEFARSTILEIGKIITQMLILQAIKTAFGVSGDSGNVFGEIIGGLFGFGKSAPVGFSTAAASAGAGGGVTPFGGVSRIQNFNPQAILNSAGNAASRGGDINIYNQASSANVEATRRTDGGTDIVITERSMASSVNRGGNALSAALESTYGLRRVR